MIRVLICDDQTVVRDGLEMILNADKEIEVVGLAQDGAEALELILSNSPDVVLMDLHMPVMGGIETTEIIRNSIDKTIPIIALTAAAMKDDEEKSFAVGMNDYLSKPITIDKLKSKLIKWARGRSDKKA